MSEKWDWSNYRYATNNPVEQLAEKIAVIVLRGLTKGLVWLTNGLSWLTEWINKNI